MTREEAIEVIEQDIPCEHDTDLIEALEMAIKALEQEPCDDAISRQAVLDLIADYDLSKGQVVRGIHALPSVKPQMKDEDVAKAFQIGMALGFGEKYDKMGKVIDEIKKVTKPQEKTRHCKECKYSEYCKRWGNKYKAQEDDYCFMFEPQERGDKE